MPRTHFFDLLIEIRVSIYTEVLIKSGSIIIVTPEPWHVICPKIGVHPELLRVNKWIHREARPLLYSANRFKFHDFFWVRECVDVAPFLRQIGSQAQFIRHMSINFPTFSTIEIGETFMNIIDKTDLESIRDNCTNLTTLELVRFYDVFYYTRRTCKLKLPLEGPNLIDTVTRAMPSLKQIDVVIVLSGNENVSEDVINRMRDYGWNVQVGSSFKIFQED